MNIFQIDKYTSFRDHNTDLSCEFKLINLAKGEVFSSINCENNNIIFVSEGEIELSYDNFIDRRFKNGTIIFMPQSSNISGKVIADCKLIILLFNTRFFNINDRYMLSQYTKYRDEINYNFQSIDFKEPIIDYLNLLEIYIDSKICCFQMHEIKLEELAVILKTVYSEEEIATFFYPMLGKDVDFKSIVLAKYRMEYSIKDMAAMLSMHEKYFPRKFKEEFGISFHQWKLKQKANLIKHRLVSPQTTIKDIIIEFEFSNFAHFNRFCKKQFDCAPTELTRKLKNL